MRNGFIYLLITLFYFLIPNINYGQAPSLGAASNFALFTAAGAFSNVGLTQVTGDIGTNVGAFSGFPPGIVIGSVHVADVISAQAAADVDVAYGILSAATCGQVIGTTLGNGQILTPNVYCLGGASTINGDLILNGQCNPNSFFLIKINGALSTSVLSRVILTNGASLCNVYWQVNGAVALGEGSEFRGTIVANGAISLLEGSSLFGRGLTRQGAIDLHNNFVDSDLQPSASVITANGATTFCTGGSVTLSGNCGGVWSNGATTPTITVTASGNYSVNNSNNCGTAISNHIIVTVNPLPVCTISGNLAICAGQSTQLCVPAGAASYLWSNGATTNCIIASAAGVYAITVTSAAGCSSTCNATVTALPVPVCTISGNLAICAGQSTQLCAPAGAASYLWSTGGTNNCITASAAGPYSVTVTNAAGCSSICSVTVSVNPLPVCTISGNLAICAGQSTQLCAPAGAASYLWSTGATTNCITASAAGAYAITVTSAAGCSSICSVTVTVNPFPVCTISGNLAICAGQSTQLCAPAGAASYLWSTGATTNCITASAAGAYAITVTNAAGCSSICSVTVTVNPLPVCTISGNLAICAGQSTQLCAPAGAASYLWSTGATTNCITASAAGAYAITVTNAAGCSSICSVTVTVNPLPVCTISGNDFICQTGQTTQLCVPAGAASYLWSTGAITNCINVGAGTFTVTVTNSSGCSSICSETVTVNPQPVCLITGNLFLCETGQTTQLCVPTGATSYLWSTGATTNCITVSNAGNYSVMVMNADGCNSSCSATVTINQQPVCTITGNNSICEGQSTALCVPAGAASYLWSNGSITNCINVNTAGIYSVTITYVNGCSSICSETVTMNPLPVCTITGNLSVCPGTSTQLCVLAGAGSYLWSTGATTNCISVNTAGNYAVTVTNASGCSSVCSATVVILEQPVCTITGDQFLCTPGQSTQICVPAGAESYLWSTGATTNCINVNEPGVYSVTVTYSGGCTSVCSATVTVNQQPVCTITGNNSICDGQSTELCVPTGAASYLWSNGSTTHCITVNTAGVYSVTVTYANGCSSICSETVIVNPLPVCTITGDDFICEDGQLTQLCVPAGAGTYLWSTGATTNCIIASAAGTYFVTVTNQNGCSSICSKTITLHPPLNCVITGVDFICDSTQSVQICVIASASATYLWSTGETTSCINAGVGTYYVTVNSSNGCSSVCSKTITLHPLPVCTISCDDVICEGEFTQLCVATGAASYLWSTGDTTHCITTGTAGTYSVTVTMAGGCSSICSKIITVVPNPVCGITGNCTIACGGQPTLLCAPAGCASYWWNTGATTNCITVSTPGNYCVTITNSNGCSSICCVTVSGGIIPNCEITGNCSLPCNGQPTLLCAPAGCASYWWNTGATTSCISVNTPGNYCVTVTYSNGCSSVCSKIVTGAILPVCEITGNCTLPCNGQPTWLCAPAGCASYWWNTGATTSCINVSTPGNYCVTVTYSSGCSSVCSKIVTGAILPVCEITGNCTLPCNGQPTWLCAPAGCAAYWWNTGATTSCINVNTPGNYCVTVTYSNGCSSVCSRIVTNDTAQECHISGNCVLPCDGQPALLCAPSGCASYLWSTGATTSCINVSTPGNYCVTVTYSSGCSSVCSKIVTGAILPVCEITGNCTLPCNGQPTWLCAPAGCAAYWWNTGATTSCINVNTPGNYCVTVTYSNGCSSVCSRIVTNNTAQECHISGNCVLPCDGQPALLCAPSGCTSYLWSTGATTSCIIASQTGNYCVTVTYLNGCTASTCVNVTQESVPVCTIEGDTTISTGQPALLCAPNGFATYLWSTGATTSCIIAALPGEYSVTVTNASGCTGICSTGVQNFILQTSDSDTITPKDGYLLAKVYPNPFYAKTTLEFVNSESDSHVVIEVFKINETNLLTIFDGDVEKGKLYHVDLESNDLSPGVYVCRIANGNQIIIKKLILIR